MSAPVTPLSLAISGVMSQYLSQIRVENRRRVLQFVGEAGEVLQLAHRLLRLAHALSSGIDLTADQIRVLPVDRHLGERLDFALHPIQLDRDELRVLLRALVVVEAQLRHGDAVLQRSHDPFVARLLRGRQILAQLLETDVDVFDAYRLEKSVERALRHEQTQEQPQQSIETWRANLFSGPGIASRGTADANGQVPHLHTTGV